MTKTGNIEAVVPLESNPQIFTDFAHNLGLSPLLEFTDIYSLEDPDLLAFIPRPVKAVILLFPVTEEYEAYKNLEGVETLDNEKVIWMKQVVKNACGLYALLHALLNIQDGLIVQESRISKFKKQLLKENADPVSLVQNIAKQSYSNYSNQGQTEAPLADDDVELHFVCFIKNENGIYELDGRRNGPILLKSMTNTTSDILDDDCVNLRVKKYMSLVSGDNALRFALMGLAPSIN